MRVFQASLCRAFFSKRYLIHLAISFVMSVLGIIILKMVQQEMLTLPSKYLDVFKMGENYNIGVVAIRDLSVLKTGYYDDIVTGVFAGSVSQLVIVFSVSSFIYSEIKNGYMYYLIMKGVERARVSIYYIGISCIMCETFMIVYLVGTVLALAFNNMLSVKDVSKLALVIITQMVMMLAISACTAVITLMIGKSEVKIALLILVVGLPTIPKYFSIVFKSGFDLEKWLVFSRLVSSGTMNSGECGWNILISGITAMIICTIGIVVFSNKRFN